jgi:hypothetical protein
MRFEKTLLDKSAKALLDKAEDCFGLAKTQHEIADKQHEIAASQHSSADNLDTSADKLAALGHALEADAVELKGETEIIAARTDPRPREGAASMAPKAGSPPPPAIPKK